MDTFNVVTIMFICVIYWLLGIFSVVASASLDELPGNPIWRFPILVFWPLWFIWVIVIKPTYNWMIECRDYYRGRKK